MSFRVECRLCDQWSSDINGFYEHLKTAHSHGGLGLLWKDCSPSDGPSTGLEPRCLYDGNRRLLARATLEAS